MDAVNSPFAARQKVVDRLRTTLPSRYGSPGVAGQDQQRAENDRWRGRQAGRDWASDTATYTELNELVGLHAQVEQVRTNNSGCMCLCHARLVEMLAAVAPGEGEAYRTAFLEAAKAVWAEVAHLI